MDESKLLEECVSIELTPLQTLLLSKTVIVIHTLIDFLHQYNCLAIEKVKNDDSSFPDYEQTGNILIKSALTSLEEIRSKIWESGKEEIGEEVPEEFEEILAVYTVVVEQIANEFVMSLKGKRRE